MKDGTDYLEELEASVDPLEDDNVDGKKLDEDSSEQPDWTDEDIEAFSYVNMPDGEVGTAIAFYDAEGEVIDLEDAKVLPGAHVVAADASLRIFQFNVRENTFERVRLH